MRRLQAEADHDPPFLEGLVENAIVHVGILDQFDIRHAASFTHEACEAIQALWLVFEQLSHRGRARNGLAGVVGVSKATMLLTDGRVGPAFDSRVRANLVVGDVHNADEWLQALRIAQIDIHAFELAMGVTLQEAVPEFAHLHSGRLYDMALGPAQSLRIETT